MPCMCWYDPTDEDKKKFKDSVQNVVNIIRELRKIGDPRGVSIKDAHELLDHLYNPTLCKEKDH